MIGNPYRELEKALGYRFRNKKRLTTALAHPSFGHESEQELLESNNQRLEFLGDAALSLICAAQIYVDCPDLPEGDMTKMRSGLVSTVALAEIGQELGLGNHLLLGRGEESSGGRERASNLADAMEAVLGAAYLDGGLKAVQKIFTRLFKDRLEKLEDADLHSGNPKGELQERIQRQHKVSPTYRIAEESGPAHQREFKAEVLVGDEILGQGEGLSKRAAEMQAARAALKHLNREETA